VVKGATALLARDIGVRATIDIDIYREAVAHTLDDGLATVTPFLDPLFDGSAAGTWDPEHRRWTT